MWSDATKCNSSHLFPSIWRCLLFVVSPYEVSSPNVLGEMPRISVKIAVPLGANDECGLKHRTVSRETIITQHVGLNMILP